MAKADRPDQRREGFNGQNGVNAHPPSAQEFTGAKAAGVPRTRREVRPSVPKEEGKGGECKAK